MQHGQTGDHNPSPQPHSHPFLFPSWPISVGLKPNHSIPISVSLQCRFVWKFPSQAELESALQRQFAPCWDGAIASTALELAGFVFFYSLGWRSPANQLDSSYGSQVEKMLFHLFHCRCIWSFGVADQNQGHNHTEETNRSERSHRGKYRSQTTNTGVSLEYCDGRGDRSDLHCALQV